jgi:hypothetical protein
VAIIRAGLYWLDLALIPSVLALIGLIRPPLANIERIGAGDTHKDRRGRDAIKKTKICGYSSVTS